MSHQHSQFSAGRPLRCDRSSYSGPVAWGAEAGMGRGGNLKDGPEVGCLEAITPPGKVVSQSEEERMCKP